MTSIAAIDWRLVGFVIAFVLVYLLLQHGTGVLFDRLFGRLGSWFDERRARRQQDEQDQRRWSDDSASRDDEPLDRGR